MFNVEVLTRNTSWCLCKSDRFKVPRPLAGLYPNHEVVDGFPYKAFLLPSVSVIVSSKATTIDKHMR